METKEAIDISKIDTKLLKEHVKNRRCVVTSCSLYNAYFCDGDCHIYEMNKYIEELDRRKNEKRKKRKYYNKSR